MAKLESKLTIMLEPAVEATGLELLGLELIRAGRSSVLRLYIDHEDGITVEHCAEVSRQVSAVLDVEDPIAGEYNLEVSSPGMARPLFKRAHYEAVVGQKVSLQTVLPVNGRRKFTGDLLAVEGDTLTLKVDGEEALIALNNVRKGNIVPIFD
ncbi:MULTISPECIES: ribosome maturation factor RimP [Corallincola]|uniref:Ribosome maturation factor RimP n=3 Tax=Corallincola TaxID=1775176 RepID=A0A368N3M0_9GAMM|nr:MULTISPECIES: ribosome maturation factor RimP [Corallincola]RCU44653.1 ribosome maturation factor RimP [Corallincola holothuriorum]TAA40374.1 ribosome maturation factor RimP [Corallincola spongiicola]TCI05314.1 ribosome maturation factor RimP [Corallincola luteus]